MPTPGTNVWTSPNDTQWRIETWSQGVSATYVAPFNAIMPAFANIDADQTPEWNGSSTTTVQVDANQYPEIINVATYSGDQPVTLTVNSTTVNYTKTFDVLPGNIFVLYLDGGVTYTPSTALTFAYENSGSGSVIWFAPSQSARGDVNLRGAHVQYHAFSQLSGTIVGTILIANDSGSYNITHQEATSGSADINQVNLWARRINSSESNIYFMRDDSVNDTVFVQFTATLFYAPDKLS